MLPVKSENFPEQIARGFDGFDDTLAHVVQVVVAISPASLPSDPRISNRLDHDFWHSK